MSEYILNVLPYAVQMRRKVHTIAELSCMEYKTQQLIVNELTALGLKHYTIQTGVVCDIPSKDKSKAALNIGFRCDIDALPITERTDLPFAAAENMHACGHDGHTAILLAVAKVLSNNPPKNNVRLIFQYGEESGGGAEQMIASGAADGLDEIYALHLTPDYPKGKIALKDGVIFAGKAVFDIEFEGRAAHCADASKGVNALTKAVDFYNQIPLLLGKYADESLLFAGKLHAGDVVNIVPKHAVLGCTVRYFSSETYGIIMENIANTLYAINTKYGLGHSIKMLEQYIPLINSKKCVDKIKRLVPNTIQCKPQFTAEDFAFFAEKIPGAMVWLGVKDERHNSPLHADTFDFDENVLSCGINLFLKLCSD